MKKLLCVSLPLLCFSGAAFAQRWEFGANRAYLNLSTKPLGSFSVEGKKDDDTKLTARWATGGRITFNTPGYYGYELGYWQSKATITSLLRTTTNRVQTTETLTDSITLRQYTANFLVYFMPANEWWRPYITGGIHRTDYPAPRFEAWPTGKANILGFNYGFGIKLMPVKHFIIRLDARDYLGGKPYDLQYADPLSLSQGIYRNQEVSAGISIGF